MNIKDFINIILPLFGVVIGGFMTIMTIRVQFRNQEKQRREERKIKTYEEIHKYLSIINDKAKDIFVECLGSIRQEVLKGPKLPWEELEMLINFYTPELKEDIKIIKEIWIKLGLAFGVIMAKKIRQTENLAGSLKQMKELQIEEFRDQIEKQVDIAKNKLANLVNKII